MTCPPHQLEFDAALGQSFCRICGCVIEENGITSDIAFIEGGDGAARMVGQFISQERSGLRGIGGMKNRHLSSGQSREETIANAKRRFQQVAIALKGLGEYHIDRGLQCYKLALSKNFTQGRKQGLVVASCLYIVCRQEKTMHMLIDFSDVLHTNVFTLGATFLKLVKVLDIKLPLIDPSLYLARFAAHSSLGLATTEKLTLITNDALRIIQRMKRDWIHYGRRPSGLCGAALFIACRMHGFNRTESEIVKVVKICEGTLKKRLMEFSSTASGELSIEQFRTVDLSDEANPPSFKSQRSRRKAAKTEEDDLDDEEKALNVEEEMHEAINNQENKSYPKWEDTEIDADVAEWSDLEDDEEINACFLEEEEIKTKQEVWEELNKDWILKQELKKKKEEAEGPKPPPKKRRKREPIKADNATEATKEYITTKIPTISRKINVAALDNLFA